MIDRLLALLRRSNFTPTWPSLVRIAIWFVVGVFLVDALAPDKQPDLAADRYNAAAPDPSVRSITAARGDPRGFTSTSNDGVFKIAWVGGSELQSIGGGVYTFLPIAVRQKLPEIDGRPVSIDMYFVSGIRLADEYAAVLAAIDDDVDALVISLNPVWSLNDLAVHGWDNLDPQLARNTLLRPASWPVAASLVSPGDLLWGFTSDVDVLDDRYQWGVRIQDEVSRLGLIDDLVPSPAVEDETAPSELDRIRQMTIPVEFWSRYAPTVDPAEPVAVRQAALFERTVLSSGINGAILDLIGDAVTGTDIPTLVYTAAVSDDVLTDPEIAAQIEAIESQLAEHARAFEADNVRYDPFTIARRAPGMTFNDVVHIADLGPLADVMTTDLCDLLVDTGVMPDCEPV